MKSILIRVDSSTHIGLGHLMRCLTLAERMRAANCRVFFVSCDLPGHGMQLIRDKDFEVFVLNPFQNEIFQIGQRLQDAMVDLVIIDHYALEKNWEKNIKAFAKKVMVIDDLANRAHDCDILLDQSYTQIQDRYTGLIPHTTLCLLGPQYALLRDEFSQLRHNLITKNNLLKHILISFGGSDPYNMTEKAIMACTQVKETLQLTVVIGSLHPQKKSLLKLCESFANVNFHLSSNQMASLMVAADLAIGAAGMTTWERCCVGLPAIVITIAKNQEDNAKQMAQLGAIHYLGSSEELSIKRLYDAIHTLIAAPQQLNDMRAAGKQLVDGKGCSRVMEKLMQSGML